MSKATEIEAKRPWISTPAVWFQSHGGRGSGWRGVLQKGWLGPKEKKEYNERIQGHLGVSVG